MKRLVLGVAAALALTFAGGIGTRGTALADFGGTPGEPNCHGKAVSHATKDHLAFGHAFRELFEPDLHDAGDLHDLIRAACEA